MNSFHSVLENIALEDIKKRISNQYWNEAEGPICFVKILSFFIENAIEYWLFSSILHHLFKIL